MKIKYIDIDTSDIEEIKYIQDKLIRDLTNKYDELLQKNNIDPSSVYPNVSYEYTEQGVNVTVTVVPKNLDKFYEK